MGFKPQKEYRPVTKKPNASSSGNKKKGVEPTIEVSNSNSFDVLNSVNNDVEFGTNGGTTNLVNNGATLSGSFFMNIDNDGEFASNAPIGEKINKIERKIGEGKLRLLDNDGNPLVPMGIVESDSEVEVAILASSSEVPSVLEFLQRRKLEAKKEVAASEFSHLNHSLSHRPVSVKPDISKPDISKASSAGGKLHILKPSCERNGITPTPKESLSPTSGSKVPNSPLTGESNLLIVKASAD
ncbi:hypothetical protein Tco_1418371 [Tanacetum coccineum]